MPGFLVFDTLRAKGNDWGSSVQSVWAGLRDKAALLGEGAGFRVGCRFPGTDPGNDFHAGQS